MFKEELEKILDEQIKNLFYETEGVYPFEKAEPYIKSVVTSIINLVDKEVIGEDEELPEWGKLRIDIRNELRAEMRENVWKI